MSLPRIDGDHFEVAISTTPNGSLEVQFGHPDDAREFLIAQARLYKVSAFRATITEHTAAATSLLHTVDWAAERDSRLLHRAVTDTLRHDLARMFLADLDAELQADEAATSPLVRAKWGWNVADDTYRLDAYAETLTLADGTELDGWEHCQEACLDDVADRQFLATLFGLTVDEPLVIIRGETGLSVSGDEHFIQEPLG